MDKMDKPPFYIYFGQVCLNNQFLHARWSFVSGTVLLGQAKIGQQNNVST